MITSSGSEGGHDKCEEGEEERRGCGEVGNPDRVIKLVSKQD